MVGAQRASVTGLRKLASMTAAACLAAGAALAAGGSPGVAAAARTKVTFATWGSVSDWKPYVDMFEADNPDIDVEVIASDWGTYWQKIDVMLAGAMDVDVVRLGGRIYTPDLSQSALDDRKAIEALGFLTGLATQHRVMPSEAQAWGAWMDGHVGFTHGAPSYMSGWSKVKFRFDLVPLPIPEGGKETAANVLNLLAITKTSRHPEAAWRFIEYILGEKVQRERIKKWTILSARRQIALETVTGGQLPVAHPAVLVRIADTSFPMQAAPGYVQIDQIIGDTLAKVVAGTWPIETAIREQIVPQVNKILAGSRK